MVSSSRHPTPGTNGQRTPIQGQACGRWVLGLRRHPAGEPSPGWRTVTRGGRVRERRPGPTAPVCRATRSGPRSRARPACSPGNRRVTPCRASFAATTRWRPWTRPADCTPWGTALDIWSAPGRNRELTGHPVPYPAANSPQAWSTGSPLLLLRTVLGLEPYGEDLVVAPVLPARFGRIELLDIPGRWGRVDAIGTVQPHERELTV